MMKKIVFLLSVVFCLGFCRADDDPILTELYNIEGWLSSLVIIQDGQNQNLNAYYDYIIKGLNVINTNFAAIVTASADKQTAYLNAISNILTSTKNILFTFPLFSETGSYSSSSISGTYTFRVFDQVNANALVRIMRQLLLLQTQLVDIKGLIPTDLFELVPYVGDILNQLYGMASSLYNIDGYLYNGLENLFGDAYNPSWSTLANILSDIFDSISFSATVDFPEFIQSYDFILDDFLSNYPISFTWKAPQRWTYPNFWNNYSISDSDDITVSGDGLIEFIEDFGSNLSQSLSQLEKSLMIIALSFTNDVEGSLSDIEDSVSSFVDDLNDIKDSFELDITAPTFTHLELKGFNVSSNFNGFIAITIPSIKVFNYEFQTYSFQFDVREYQSYFDFFRRGFKWFYFTSFLGLIWLTLFIIGKTCLWIKDYFEAGMR